MYHKSLFHKTWRGWIVLATLLLSLPALSLTRANPAVPNNPGNLDTTFAGFGAGGKVVVPGNDLQATTLLPDGRIVTAGTKNGDMLLMRFLPDGRFDPSFFGNGSTQLGAPGYYLVVNSVAAQADGKLVVAGSASPFGTTDFFVARVDPAIGLDASFGDGGFVMTDFDNQYDGANAVLVQPDGKIVAGGNAMVGNDYDFAVARYNANGSLDTSFSGDGKATIGFGGDDRLYDMALQSDGKLVLVGDRDGDFAVARLNANGTLDTSFDGDGKLTTNFGGHERAEAVVIQPDGKIVVLGPQASPHKSHMARYLPSGALDTTFGSGGKLTIPVDRLYDLALQPDGKFVALGTHTSPDGDNKFALHRLLPNGAHDITFDGDGIAWLDFGGNDVGRALALQPDGRILAAGKSGSAAVLVRLWPNGTTFDSGGQQTHNLAFPPAYAPGADAITSALAVQPDGKLLVAGELRNPGAPPFGDHSAAFVTRFLAEGRVDPTFGSQGTALVDEAFVNFAARALALQPDGKVVLAGHYTQDFLLVRLLENGAPDPGAWRPSNLPAGDCEVAHTK
jgi:uncharacterized delta-60 repeat protein